jgi:hypothetical protein
MAQEAKRTVSTDIRREFDDAGFEVIDRHAGEIEVRKNSCTHSLVCNAAGRWMPSSPAHFLVRGVACELEDRGYQKFWLAGGKRFPIRLADLRALQSFDQEVRALLHLKSLYHESLGTTCARSAYDRLEGRPDR